MEKWGSKDYGSGMALGVKILESEGKLL